MRLPTSFSKTLLKSVEMQTPCSAQPAGRAPAQRVQPQTTARWQPRRQCLCDLYSYALLTIGWCRDRFSNGMPLTCASCGSSSMLRAGGKRGNVCSRTRIRVMYSCSSGPERVNMVTMHRRRDTDLLAARCLRTYADRPPTVHAN
jgi:hypothetical protein